MKTAALVSRILLGLIFSLAGMSGYLLIHHPPAMPPGLAGSFQDVFFRSGWVLFVDTVELVSALLLLVNRYVPLALTALAAVIANILFFHISMAPAGLPVAIIVAALWTITAIPLRSHFAPLFAQRTEPAAGSDSRVRDYVSGAETPALQTL